MATVIRRLIRVMEIPDTGSVPNARFVANVITSEGAVGDGVNDDTTAIQAAIANLPT